MKTVGLIGGVGPESTVEYYKLIVEAYRQLSPDGSYPSILINSVNLKKLIDLMNQNELGQFTDELAGEIERLERGGADFGALTANTPHIVFDELQRRARIPLLSIVEAACERIKGLGFKKIGLLGTRFTMQARFYPEVFSRAGLEIVVPDEKEQSFIHEKYLGELLNNLFLPETRESLLAIADALRFRHQVDGIILGGTELPLLLRDSQHNGIPLFDTTRIHVDRIVSELTS